MFKEEIKIRLNESLNWKKSLLSIFLQINKESVAVLMIDDLLAVDIYKGAHKKAKKQKQSKKLNSKPFSIVFNMNVWGKICNPIISLSLTYHLCILLISVKSPQQIMGNELFAEVNMPYLWTNMSPQLLTCRSVLCHSGLWPTWNPMKERGEKTKEDDEEIMVSGKKGLPYGQDAELFLTPFFCFVKVVEANQA